jgi:hypothetical protein
MVVNRQDAYRLPSLHRLHWHCAVHIKTLLPKYWSVGISFAMQIEHCLSKKVDRKTGKRKNLGTFDAREGTEKHERRYNTSNVKGDAAKKDSLD